MSILESITAYKRKEVAAAREAVSLATLEARAKRLGPSRGFRDSLLKARSAGRRGLIAEIKRASPSKGVIRADFDPPALARSYELGGATCLSVLTDAPSFSGSLEHLTQARDAVSLPVLRKDFILDPYQVFEARAWGADCVLAILACLEDSEARTLLKTARGLEMDTLVEVHDEHELDRALVLGAQMIGINNRDLNSFVTDLAVTLRLAPRIPQDRLVVAESGLTKGDDLKRLADAGVTTFLVGESLLREHDVEAATRTLLRDS